MLESWIRLEEKKTNLLPRSINYFHEKFGNSNRGEEFAWNRSREEHPEGRKVERPISAIEGERNRLEILTRDLEIVTRGGGAARI